MPPYEVTVDEGRHALRATLRGFWDVPTTRAYIAALTAAAERVSRHGEPSWWLIDLSESTIQSAEVADLMSSGLAHVIPPGAVLAVVTTKALRAMQAKRVVADHNHYYFATVATANAWLAEQGRP